MRNLALAAVLAAFVPVAAAAQEKLMGEVFMTAASFCPRGTLPADGRELTIANDGALFALVGTMYGGDGQRTFHLPDLRGRVPIGIGQPQDLDLRSVHQGERGGRGQAQIGWVHMPSHSHSARARLRASGTLAATPNPKGAVLAITEGGPSYAREGGPRDWVELDPRAVTVEVEHALGGEEPISTRDPWIGMRYCVVIDGPFPAHP